MKKTNQLLRSLTSIIIAFIVLFGLVFITKFMAPIYHVSSGSMEPSLPVGSIVVTKHEESYSPGEIITFQLEDGTIVTHRLVETKLNGELVTKGDANQSKDNWRTPLTKADVIGKTIIIVAATAPSFWLSLRGIGVLVCIVVITLMLFWHIETDDEGKSKSKPLGKYPKASPALDAHRS